MPTAIAFASKMVRPVQLTRSMMPDALLNTSSSEEFAKGHFSTILVGYCRPTIRHAVTGFTKQRKSARGYHGTT